MKKSLLLLCVASPIFCEISQNQASQLKQACESYAKSNKLTPDQEKKRKKAAVTLLAIGFREYPVVGWLATDPYRKYDQLSLGDLAELAQECELFNKDEVAGILDGTHVLFHQYTLWNTVNGTLKQLEQLEAAVKAKGQEEPGVKKCATEGCAEFLEWAARQKAILQDIIDAPKKQADEAFEKVFKQKSEN